jgi:NifU-like protein involved in Fe-S cluster formation
MQHVIEPRNEGKLEGATHLGQIGVPGDGPYLVIALTIKQKRIVDAKYQTYGCPSAIVCSSVVCQIAKGRMTEKLYGLTAGDVTRIVGGLPEGKEHLAEWAAEALRQALDPIKGKLK